MSASISITSLPSTAGATQTREIQVGVSAPNTGGPFETTVRLLVDATQNGSFRELTESRRQFQSDGSADILFTPFIGVQPPYDLRATVAFVSESGDETVATDTVTIGETSAPTVDEIDAQQFDLDASTTTVRGGDAIDVTPRIGPVEPIILSAEYQLPWDRDNNQTACGQSIQTQNGDFNWRIVFKGVMTLSQLDRLRALRESASAVETRSAVFGIREVNFDQLSLTRPESPSAIQIDGEVQPIVEFQLQTKELDEQGSSDLFGGN